MVGSQGFVGETVRAPGGGSRTLVRALAILAGCLFLLALAPAAHAAGITVDASVKTHQQSASTSITSGALTTTSSNDLLVAFIASDGPSSAGSESFSSVTGGGLTWTLRQRTNTQPGTAEIWQAVAPNPVSNLTVTAKRSSGSYVGSIDVVAFSGANTTVNGAVAGKNGTTGAPTVSLTTTQASSWVWGIGDDWDNATSRTAGSGQTIFDQDLASAGDTYWVQSTAAPGNSAGTSVTLNDTSPTTDRWDFSAIEITPATPDTTPPSAPSNLQATAVSSNQVSLTWGASTDNVGVAGYAIFRNGTQIATTTGTSYVDNGVSPATNYSYTVEAYDASGNYSLSSNTATVTTPPVSTNPPNISNITVSNLTTTSATVSWTTDIPSSSQVFYGMSSQYGENTTLDNTQVTSHSQTLTGLLPGTQYHYEVQSTGSVNNTATSSDATFSTLAANITLPDLQIKVPTNDFSVGTDPSTGHRQLQFTHITWDSGSGPFEMDPNYNSATGIATWTQAIYNSPSPGVWNLDHHVPIEAIGIFQASEDHYTFPLTKFTLNTVNADGSIGSVVTTSPKTDYCINGDTYVGGVPNTPGTSSPPQSNCNDPTKPLGWSVGWGDQYDQTDPGQPIDLTGVPNGTYILRGVADPEHVFTESDNTDNATDTEIQITNNTVTVLGQTTPTVTPPSVSVTSPSGGSDVSGTVTLQASASTTAPGGIQSVQFLLDGQPLGSPVTTAPYTYNWTVGSTSLGSHAISARVTDAAGNMNTAAPVNVNVVSGPPPPPNNPTVNITNPVNNETVSGTVPVAATATANLPIASVQFFLDGQALGSPVTTAPYSISWDTTKVSAGTHVLSAQATDTNGDVGTSSNVTVTVQNPPPPMTCYVMQVDLSVHGHGKLTTPSFNTIAPGETLLAFVSADGPTLLAQTASVSGAGLTWKLIGRENAQKGDSEIWAATATNPISNATVTSTLTRAAYDQDLTVIAMEETNGVGASAEAAGRTGAPSVKLTTTGPNSLIFAVGNDWDNATPRALPANWTMLDQWVDTGGGNDLWSQYTSPPIPASGTTVTVGDTAPTSDRWNLVAVELTDSPS